MAESNQPVEAVNEGRGLSAEQFAEFLDESGLTEAVLNLDEAENSRRSPKPGSREETEEFIRASKEQGLYQDPSETNKGSTRGEATGDPRTPSDRSTSEPVYPQQVPQAPQQHPAVQQLNELSRAFDQVQANLQAIAANRQALVQQHGPGAVAAQEAHLRGTLNQIDGMGQHVRAQLDQQVRQAQHHQRTQALEQGRMLQKQLCREFSVNEAELANMAHEGFRIMEERGVPRSRVERATAEEARQILHMVADRRAKEAAEKRAALAEKKAQKARTLARARPDPDRVIHGPHGAYREGDGSLAAAAAAFHRLGFR